MLGVVDYFLIVFTYRCGTESFLSMNIHWPFLLLLLLRKVSRSLYVITGDLAVFHMYLLCKLLGVWVFRNCHYLCLLWHSAQLEWVLWLARAYLVECIGSLRCCWTSPVRIFMTHSPYLMGVYPQAFTCLCALRSVCAISSYAAVAV